MNQRSLLALGVAALVLMILALVFSGNQRVAERLDREPLIPGLREQVNDIDAIDVLGPGGELIASLRRDRDRWRVMNRDAFEADFRQVHDVLRELARAVRAEERTALAEWYPRLGLAAIDSPQARGLQLEFPGRGLPAIILGDRDPSTGGRYARLADEAQSWLTDQALHLADSAIGWLERSVMDIPARELAEVTILHPDGDRLRLRPADDEGEQWVLLDIPAGREAGPRWDIRPVANGLANVTLEDVRRHETVPDDAVRALYVTRDGLNFVVSLFAEADVLWAHFSVSAEIGAGEDEAGSEGQHRQLMADAAAVDARLAPWQFALPLRKYENMTRRLEDLLLTPAGD